MALDGKDLVNRLGGNGRYPVIPEAPPPEEQRGDAWEPPSPVIEEPPASSAATQPPFPEPVPASRLKKAEAKPWLWRGYLGRGDIALFSALWKAGKTTLLTYLLRSLGDGSSFCGLAVQPSRVLYVTEESEGRWAERRDAVGIQDNVEFLVRPFRFKPRWDAWVSFLAHLRDTMHARESDVVILDTLSNLWPVRDENDAAQVQSALQPLHWVAEARAALLLVHHNRKSDGEEATAARGSGALMGFVDTIIELRRYRAADKDDCRRVLTAYGRDDETPKELVVELASGRFDAIGDRQDASAYSLHPTIAGMLPAAPPGMTAEEMLEAWPEDTGQPEPGRERLSSVLRKGADLGWWRREGEGRRGSPRRYWSAPRNC